MSKRPGPLLLAETFGDLVAASLALRLRSFEAIVSGRDAPANLPQVAPHDAVMLERALKAWNRRLPWRTLCFEQGLAAERWLRRRGLASRLHYGAAGRGEGPVAHVWVTSGTVPVVGCEQAGEFVELAQFPHAEAPQSREN
ncbi:lasso peptide biosynthesis B2 protein [Sphingomicrobium nitratireducens]|uniref:lasso peptide biosynthesis B2 protein n=1 Tax=Sphingomicrobium nitratireducens TaxID=2964666 RepID=UPI00223EE06A|nr:lasso peptide biosynthesis B2 protein [Sphingomicrobium nitratireducens]